MVRLDMFLFLYWMVAGSLKVWCIFIRIFVFDSKFLNHSKVPIFNSKFFWYLILCPLIISTFSWGQKRCAYYERAQYLLLQFLAFCFEILNFRLDVYFLIRNIYFSTWIFVFESKLSMLDSKSYFCFKLFEFYLILSNFHKFFFWLENV